MHVPALIRSNAKTVQIYPSAATLLGVGAADGKTVSEIEATGVLTFGAIWDQAVLTLDAIQPVQSAATRRASDGFLCASRQIMLGNISSGPAT